jgi:hypothetical protein
MDRPLTVLVVSPLDAPWHTPGAVQVDADCGHRAWLSTSGLALKLGGGVITRCEDCVDPATLNRVEAVPGAREELAAILGASTADRVVTEFEANPVPAMRTLQADNRRRRRGKS